MSNSVTSWTAARQASLSFTISQRVLKLMSIESVMPSNHLILYCPLLLLPSIFPSNKIFSSELALPIRWPRHSNFSFCISPSKEYFWDKRETAFNDINSLKEPTSYCIEFYSSTTSISWVWSLGWEVPLGKGMATHSSILAWRIPWTEEPGRLQSTELQWVTNTHPYLGRITFLREDEFFTFMTIGNIKWKIKRKNLAGMILWKWVFVLLLILNDRGSFSFLEEKI